VVFALRASFSSLIGSGKVCSPKGLFPANRASGALRAPLAVLLERDKHGNSDGVAWRRAKTLGDRPSLGRCLLVRATEVRAAECRLAADCTSLPNRRPLVIHVEWGIRQLRGSCFEKRWLLAQPAFSMRMFAQYTRLNIRWQRNENGRSQHRLLPIGCCVA